MRHVLLTGGSGYVGGLSAAALLATDEDLRLHLPVRAHHDSADVLRWLEIESLAAGGPGGDALAARVRLHALPPLASLEPLRASLPARIDAVVHAMGCLDYYDGEALHAVNVEGTRSVLDLAAALGAERIFHVSTAFAGGYQDKDLPETLHEDPGPDPTKYTESKRAAESLVAASPVPSVILRPSILIGDSRDGHYTGKTYGLYQLWHGICRLLLERYHPHFEIVASDAPVPLLHQDAWQAALVRAWTDAPAGSIAHVCAPRAGMPSMRDLWHLWMERVLHPASVRYHDDFDTLPIRDMDRRQRALLAAASTNLEIGRFDWRFQTETLDACANDAHVPWRRPATLESVWRCQQQFMHTRPRLAAWRNEHAVAFSEQLRVERVSGGETLAR